jgi:asparagine synthase (glutamine-hydrolysing)
MCGIAGVLDTRLECVPGLESRLGTMERLLRHRGPDGEGQWMHPRGQVGFAHQRLSIIDLSPAGAQPMSDGAGNWVVYNGEIYNYVELREELGTANFTSHSDTEVILRAWRRWGRDCVSHFRGMFAFALWDERTQTLFCARDRFGIKPFYYTVVGGTLYFASEIKALLPFVDAIETDLESFSEYLTFQFCLDGKTLFKGISELLPAHTLLVSNGTLDTTRYWQVYYDLDFNHTARYFTERLHDLLADSVRLHVRSDVPIGAYISGGLDSSTIAAMARPYAQGPFLGFTGKFAMGPEYDESRYARALADGTGMDLLEVDISASDFMTHFRRVIYHLDYPVAGPGSFPQYMVSRLAAKHRKVVLGGQGGDEVFGGYTRYLIAYFEQCIKAAIDGTMNDGHFVVTYESIIPNLTALRHYKPLLQEFWREGLFDDMDRRYFRLINRAPHLGDEIRWDALGDYDTFEAFRHLFNSDNVGKQSYFDRMTHFDFRTLLPALLQVEDRMSMAHGLESRVPLLDHPLVEFVATIPADVKFRNGTLKHIFKDVAQPYLPDVITSRVDKMGFPTPWAEWLKGETRDFVIDALTTSKARDRDLIDNRRVVKQIETESRFGRNTWGLFCLEIWQQEFHDKATGFKHDAEMSAPSR